MSETITMVLATTAVVAAYIAMGVFMAAAGWSFLAATEEFDNPFYEKAIIGALAIACFGSVAALFFFKAFETIFL